MPFAAIETPSADHGALLVSLAVCEGSASHPWLHSADLNAGPDATRNVADMLRLLSMFHEGHPGLIQIAATQNVWRGADAWMAKAEAGFTAERDYLADLIVAAGPPPSTPGDAATVSAILFQRTALETIAHSDRFGCAIGAVAAILLDWMPIRAALDTAADRLGLPVPPLALPDEEDSLALVSALPEHPRLDRTLAFGARQLLFHHRSLWDLAETRAAARRA